MKVDSPRKSPTIFRTGSDIGTTFFKKTQIFKALQKPGDLNLLNFEQVVVHEDNNQTFEKKTVLDEFLLHQTMKNRSLANFCGLIYSLLFSVNCMCSTLYPYTSPENSVESLPSDFYLGIYVLIANVVSHLIFEKFAFRGKKTDWWKIQNLQVMAFCLTMTIAQIKYLINLDSNLLFRHYKFSHFWGYLQYPVILNMFILLMHGLLIKIMSIFISQSLLITFIMIGENPLENFEIAFVLILSFSYVVFFCLFAYVEEIHIKEKYEFYLNFHKSTLDWQNIINNVPHGIALFTKDHKRLIFSNHYGNQALKINISSPEKNCFDTLSNSLGDLKKISITNTAPYPQNTFLIDSEQRMINTMKSIKKYENSILEKGTLKEILNFLEENISIYDFKSTIAYKTSEKIKIPEESRNEMGSEEKNFIVKIKRINFESTSAFLLILEDNSQSELIATLKENNAYKSKLLSSFSHELRTPLNGAMPLLKNLYDDENFKRNDSEKHYQLCIAINSLSILQSVLNDIVDYAQINSNQLQLNCTDFEIKKTITECLDVVSLQIKEKLIDLNVFIDPNIPKRFCSDQNRLSQILLNILRNAIKFSGNGGKIKFFAKNLDVLKNDIISLKVVDQGVGMTPVELARLGELLQNLKNNECSETNNQLGSLGLLISQNLALILGPSKNNSNGLRIVSKQGQGTSVEFLIEDKNGLKLGGDECPCFSELKTKTQEKHKIQTPNIKSRTGFAKHTIFWLEAEKTDDGYDDIPSEGNERSQQIKTLSSFNNPLNFIEGSTGKKPKLPKDYCCEPILVVDDDPFNLLSAEVIIKKLGYSLIKANNGKNAIEIVEKRYSKPRCNRDCKGFALILMDYNMPVMNGIEATKYLKKKMSINEIPEIPIIACSAFGAKDDLLNCFEAGMNDYIAKPITLEKLENIFNKWIKRYEGG